MTAKNPHPRVHRRAGKDPARATTLRLLYRLEVEGSSLDPLLEELEEQPLDDRDRRLVRQLLFGCLRWQKRLDWIADQFSRRPVAQLSPWARLSIRMGLYQLFWLDRIPDHAAVDASVELAKRFAHRGIAGLVNAVLRRALREADRLEYPDPRREPVAHLAVYHSHPEWLVERRLERWGFARTESLLIANNLPAPLYIRPNSLKTNGVELSEKLSAEGFALRPAGPLEDCREVVDGDRLFRTAAHAAGLFQVQDINAGLPVALLDPRPGERIADLCSAPGGKSAQLAFLMRDRGLVLAADAHPGRLRKVAENAGRLGLQSLRLCAQDARWPAWAASFRPERILVDVPCSATGVLGRHPDARWRRHPDQLPLLVARQQAILAAAFTLLSPGGLLVYSTCSLEEEENAGVVEDFLRRTPDAALEPAGALFPARPWAAHYVQTLPGREPGDGCFAARIRRLNP